MSHDTCVIDACDKPVLNQKRGWCSVHYQRWRKWGDVNWLPPVYPDFCSVEGCEKKRHAGGMCGTHYARIIRNGDLEIHRKFGRTMHTCEIDGCDVVSDRRICDVHRSRMDRHGDPHKLMRIRNNDAPDTCTVGTCTEPHWAKGGCRQHYAQMRHLVVRAEKNAKCREHYEANKLMYNVKAMRRRRNMTDGLTKEDLDISLEYRKAIMNDPCSYCGAPGEETDHIFPVNLGGKDHWWNLTRACKDCNRRKAAHCGTYYILKSGRAVDYIPPLVA